MNPILELFSLQKNFEKIIESYEEIIENDKDGELYSERVEIQVAENILEILRELNKDDWINDSKIIQEFIKERGKIDRS